MPTLQKEVQKAVQFIGTTPEEVIKPVIELIQSGFEKMFVHLQPKQPTEYITRNQVKVMFDVDLSTVHNWTKKGKLKSYGIGNRIYYKRDEVESAITPLYTSSAVNSIKKNCRK